MLKKKKNLVRLVLVAVPADGVGSGRCLAGGSCASMREVVYWELSTWVRREKMYVGFNNNTNHLKVFFRLEIESRLEHLSAF